MSIVELRKKLDTGEITAMELARKALSAIKQYDSKVGAFLYVNEELTMEYAFKAQKRIDNGLAEMLTGIPVALKDNLCTMDMPTTCASKMLDGYIPPYDATVVKKLRDADAVIVGKVNMDEFAMGASTKTSYYKRTANPYALECVSGGSSGGSAASVATDMAVFSLGSDTGGSVRQPASFCGLTGLRPTYGRISRYGVVAFASSLDQVGPMAKSAEDCAIVLETLSGKDDHDQTSEDKKFSIDELKGISVKNKRIGIISELMGKEVNQEVRDAIYSASKHFKEMGAIIENVSLPALKYAVPAYYLISSAEASANLSRFDGVRYGHRSPKGTNFNDLISASRSEGFGKEVKRRIMLGSYALCSGYYDAYYKKAVHLAELVKDQYNKAFEKYDCLLSPVAPTVSYSFDCMPANPAELYVADICTVSAALAGIPSLTTPCAYDRNGLPIGMMLTAKRWNEATILAFAEAFEKEFVRIEAEAYKL